MEESISVIVINFNGKEFIADCLDSVLASKYENLEVIVIDNASTDKSFEYLVKRYGKRIRFFRSDTQLFFTGGCNFGAAKAKNDRLVFLNSDTVVDKGWLRELNKATKGKKGIISQPKVINFFDKRLIDNFGGSYSFLSLGHCRGKNQVDGNEFQKITKVDYAVGTVFSINREFFKELGGLDEWFRYHYEDVDLCLRARKRGAICLVVSKSIVYHKGSLTVKKNVENKELLIHIRKNRLMTVYKNTNGFEGIIKLNVALFVNLLTSISNTDIGRISTLMFADRMMQSIINEGRVSEIRRYSQKMTPCVLDVGTGDGNFLHVLRGRGIRADGFDVNPRCTELFVTTSTVEKFQTRIKYDVVSFSHVLEHLQKPEKVVLKMMDCLKKDGLMMVEVPVVGNLSEKWLGRGYLAYHDKTHINLWDKQNWEKLIEKCDLNIVGIGNTFWILPFEFLRSSFKISFMRGILGFLIFLPIKILTFLGINNEVVRYYCVRNRK